MSKSHILAGALVSVLALSSAAHAYSGGITSDYLSPNGCNNCHNGGDDPEVTVTGPEFVRPLTTHEYVVRIRVTGNQTYGGFNVNPDVGTVSVGGVYSSQTHSLTNLNDSEEQITHSNAKPASGDFINFSFQWTAPASFGSATLDVWGNAVDHSGNFFGDRATHAPTTVENGALGYCPASPASCASGGKTSFALTDSDDDSKDAIAFSWSKGGPVTSTDLGDPTVGTDYYLCVYKDGALVAEYDVPAATTCGGGPCWKLKGDLLAPKGIVYKDKVGLPAGIRGLKVSAGIAGKAKLALKGKGVELIDAGILPLGGSSLTAELHNSSNSVCYGDTYSGAAITKDIDGKLKAKASH